MYRLLSLASAIYFLSLTTITNARCDTYMPALPLPHLSARDPEIVAAREKIALEVRKVLEETGLKTTSFSIGVTSQTESLFDLHHTATDKDDDRPGAETVDSHSVYRIASNTKAFTVLAILQLQKAGKLNLDDPINKHLPKLEENQTGTLPWKDITIRHLASQLSGIPRNLGLTDLADNLPIAALLGLPHISGENYTSCSSIFAGNKSRACTLDDLYNFAQTVRPIFAPKQQSTYSNNNYLVLGQLISDLSGMGYEEYVQTHILDELNMSESGFTPAADAHAVIPKGLAWSWGQDFGIQNPTGGMYSSVHDLLKWARYGLTHYNGLSPAVNWFHPVSFATGIKSFYGMPWEIYHTDDLLTHTRRPVTFVTKGGGWPGYTSIVAMVPEFGFGFVVLVGDGADLQMDLNGIVGYHMVQAANKIAHKQASKQHTGTYMNSASQDINSSITISHTDAKGLYISSFVSDSVDVLEGMRVLFLGGNQDANFHLQLLPTLLYINESAQTGEIWRAKVIEEKKDKKDRKHLPLNDQEFCITDVDSFSYGGKPIDEIVFWKQGEDGVYDEVELTGFRVKLERASADFGRVVMPAPAPVVDVKPGQTILHNLRRRLGWEVLPRD